MRCGCVCLCVHTGGREMERGENRGYWCQRRVNDFWTKFGQES